MYHPDTKPCSPCIIWKQNADHAGMKFEIEIGDCTCVPCYMNYTRNRYNNDNEAAEELEDDSLLPQVQS